MNGRPEYRTRGSNEAYRVLVKLGLGSCSMSWGCTDGLIFSCRTCDYSGLHSNCALLIPETTTHKCDKHPMKLSYFPIENHKSDYFCEICEQEFDPEFSFYHCHECMQSTHKLVLRQHFGMKHTRRGSSMMIAMPFINL
ncbi:hypothetical protein HanXRQr2_Chr16g0724541 [Helianthus annuus]|uniref:Putative DC1 n=1 Tax=Helianthus annuus TaxID=4232 RepID=A0A251RV89_HELAN|nr:hypothetical protein HanXRQr2_Chr16g0724541 [Helianthus annuus]